MPRNTRPQHSERYSGVKKALGSAYREYDEQDVDALSLMSEISLLDSANTASLKILAEKVEKGEATIDDLIKASQKVAHSRADLTKAEAERRKSMAQLYTPQEMIEFARAIVLIAQSTISNRNEITAFAREVQQLVRSVGDGTAVGGLGVNPALEGREPAIAGGLHGSDD